MLTAQEIKEKMAVIADRLLTLDYQMSAYRDTVHIGSGNTYYAYEDMCMEYDDLAGQYDDLSYALSEIYDQQQLADFGIPRPDDSDSVTL